MEYIKGFIIMQVIFLLFQYLKLTKLETPQYTELVLGSFFIIVFFGIFGSIIMMNDDLLNNSALFSCLFILWYYLTKKFTNIINSDKNGVIYY
jgi:hypothetical protein